MYTKVLLFLVINVSLTLALIRNLNVREIDEKLVEKKRQDTLEMCKIFNAETKNNQEEKDLKEEKISKRFKRTKRDIEMSDPELTIGDPNQLQRVEDIVEKLYDDMDTNYTRLITPSVQNKTGSRRFDFAPAILGLALEHEEQKYGPGEEGTVDTIKWPKKWKHGIVPYFTDPNTYDSELASTIDKAFDYFEKATCIRLQKLHQKPVDKESLSDVEWLYITNPAGIRQCVHSNEYKENHGVQIVVLGYDCMATGQIVHEVMHQLGFSHEHTRPDRNQYITVLWDNIKPGYKKYFYRRAEDPFPSIGYDYSSILHYPAKAFSKNGKVTIFSKLDTKLGQREGLSEGDLAKIGIVFGKECVERNRQYLLSTCPSVVKGQLEPPKIERSEIEDYFKDRLWPYGVVNYMIRDKLEFSVEERDNIAAVINHIQKETCIVFQDAGPPEDDKTDKSKHKSRDSGSDTAAAGTGSDKVSDSELPTNDEGEGKTSDATPSSDAENTTQPQEDGDAERRSSAQNTTSKRTKRQATRRHADNILVLTRSSTSGCACPEPGKPKANQVLEINQDCFNSVNTLLHLFVHVLGLDHQHNMHDRDSYLFLDWNNMSPEVSKEMKNVLPPAASVGFPYDYQSVMHYPWLQIKNGAKSIMYPIWNDGWSMGHWQGLSSIDVQKLEALYSEQCTARKQQQSAEQSE